jgi:predicted amidohydrolase
MRLYKDLDGLLQQAEYTEDIRSKFIELAIAGSVGNLPKVENMDIQFAQSMVFTPCDFCFPTNGIKAEATPNTEMILIVDVDLDALKELHNHGSVRNLLDRRTDLYEIKMKI